MQTREAIIVALGVAAQAGGLALVAIGVLSWEAGGTPWTGSTYVAPLVGGVALAIVGAFSAGHVSITAKRKLGRVSSAR